MSAQVSGKDSLERFTAKILQCTSLSLKQPLQRHIRLFFDLKMGHEQHIRTCSLLVGLSFETDTSKVSLNTTPWKDVITNTA